MRWLLTCLLLLGPLFCFPQHERSEYNWNWAPEYSSLIDPSGIEVIKDVWIHETKWQPKDKYRDPIVETYTINQRKLYLRDSLGIDEFRKTRWCARSPRYFEVFDARIIRADNVISDLTMDDLSVKRYDRDIGYRHRFCIDLEQAHLEPGDQLELVSVMYSTGYYTLLNEFTIHEKWPIHQKQLYVSVPKYRPKLEVVTYNGFPPMNLDTNKTQLIKHWEFKNLKAISYGPLSVRNTKYPFFTITDGSIVSPGHVLRNFNQQNEYIPYSGRKHQHALLEFVEKRKRTIGSSSRLVLIRDIVQFIGDSIVIVDDEELDPKEPIGLDFHRRRTSTKRMIALYDHLMRILDTPLYVCFTRNRYSGQVQQERADHSSYDEAVLGFEDELGVTHFLTPNTFTDRYLVDEVPYWLVGQKAMKMEMHNNSPTTPTPETLKLPEGGFLDNRMQERIMVEMDPNTWVQKAYGRGSISGQLRRSTKAFPFDDLKLNTTIPDARQRRLPIDSSFTAFGVPNRTSYFFTADLAANDPHSWENNGDMVFDLYSLAKPVNFGKDPEVITIDAVLPYGHTARSDIFLKFPEKIVLEHAVADSTKNTIGECWIKVTQLDEYMIHWSMESTLTGTWLDKNLYPLYLELIDLQSERKNFILQVKKAERSNSIDTIPQLSK